MKELICIFDIILPLLSSLLHFIKKCMGLAMDPNYYLVICFRVTLLNAELKGMGLLQILANHSAEANIAIKK